MFTIHPKFNHININTILTRGAYIGAIPSLINIFRLMEQFSPSVIYFEGIIINSLIYFRSPKIIYSITIGCKLNWNLIFNFLNSLSKSKIKSSKSNKEEYDSHNISLQPSKPSNCAKALLLLML